MANAFADGQLEPPLPGVLTLCERNCQLYTHNDRLIENRTWTQNQIDDYKIIEPNVEDNSIKTERNRVFYDEVKTNGVMQTYRKLIGLFWETSFSVPPLPPKAGEDVKKSETWEKISWFLYHAGISNRRCYEGRAVPLSLYKQPEQNIRAISWHKYADRVAIALRNNKIDIYLDTKANTKQATLSHQFQTEINCIEWQPLSGTVLAVGCASGVLIWDADWVVQYLSCPSMVNVQSIQWHPTELLLAVGTVHSSVFIWNIATSVPVLLHSLPAPSSYLLRWSPNGRYLFQASLNGTFTLWDTKNWSHERWNIAGSRIVQTAAWSPDSKYLAFSYDNTAEFHFLAVDPVMDNKITTTVPLTQFTDSSDRKICGNIAQIAWDGSGNRVAVSFNDEESENNIVALFSVAVSYRISVSPLGFIQTLGDVVQMEFRPHYLDGALLALANKDSLHIVPLYF